MLSLDKYWDFDWNAIVEKYAKLKLKDNDKFEDLVTLVKQGQKWFS